MLFSLNPHTPQCKVFNFLNSQLLNFLNRAVSATNFNSHLFKRFKVNNKMCANVCWSNKPTREKFENFWIELNKPGVDKLGIYQIAVAAQNIHLYFDDDTILLPQIVPESLFDSLKALTTHLYTRTKDIEDTKIQSNSSIGDHYQQFKIANGNSNLCYLCGTMKLAQDRHDLDGDEEQWRSDYDHLLCKDKYPLFSVHPGNFIPTCHICNSKAKGARDLLKDSTGARRVAFYSLPPSTESCDSFARVSFTLKDINQLKLDNDFIAPINSIEINFDMVSPEITKKIAVWEEVYKVSSRVKSEIDSCLIDRISGDLSPNDFDDFKNQIKRVATNIPLDIKRTEWRFWWHKLYEFLYSSGDEFLNHLWSLIEYKQNISKPDDMQSTFGI